MSSSAPNGLPLPELPRIPGPPGAAKLVRPPFEPAAPNPPLNPENPEPKDANPEVPAALANPVAAGLVASVEIADLKTEVFEPPMAPKGDCSELAKTARLDAANADEDVAAGFEVSSLGFEAPSEPKGETADVFANALLSGADPLSSEASLCRFFSGSPAFVSEASFSAVALLSSTVFSAFGSSLSSWSRLLFFFGLRIFLAMSVVCVCAPSASGSFNEVMPSSSSALESRDLFRL